MKTAGVSKNCQEPEPAGQWSVRQQENEALEVPPALLEPDSELYVAGVCLGSVRRLSMMHIIASLAKPSAMKANAS